MKWNGSPCMAPQVIFHAQRRCQHLCCVTWSQTSLVPDKGVRRLDQFGKHRDMEGGVGEASSTEVPHEEGMEDESMYEDDRQDADDEDTDEESESSSSSMQESPHSTCHFSDRCCHPHSWAEQSELGSGEDGSLGGLPASQDSEDEGESEVGYPPAPTSSCCASRSPPVSQWRQPQRFWQPQRQHHLGQPLTYR